MVLCDVVGFVCNVAFGRMVVFSTDHEHCVFQLLIAFTDWGTCQGMDLGTVNKIPTILQ